LSILSIVLFLAAQTPDREIVRRCLNESCAALTIRNQTVRFEESGNFVASYDIGPYVAEAQKLIPHEEAPVREMSTPNKWLIIASSCLDSYDNQGPSVRIRIFDPLGRIMEKYDRKLLF
jgi:hypothetical protein